MAESSDDSLSQSKLAPIIVLVLGVVILLGLVYKLTGYPFESDFSVPMSRGGFPDVIHERATAYEALWGQAHRPLSQILTDHGYEGILSGPSPRPPSALLIQTPIVLVPNDSLMPVVITVILALLAWIAWLTYRISGLPVGKLGLVSPAIVITLPVVATLTYSSLFGVLLVALILAAWRYQDRPWAGVLLGIAAGLRLWPGLVIIGFWIAGRRRLAYQAVGTFGMLTIVGLLLPGVSLEGAVSSLSEATEGWINNNQNSSLSGILRLWLGVPVFASTTVISLAGLFVAFRNRLHAVPVMIVAGLIASPLSWPTYALAALPVAGQYARQKRQIPILALLSVLAAWSLLPQRYIGVAHLLVLTTLFVLISTKRVIDPTISELADVGIERRAHGPAGEARRGTSSSPTTM